MSWPTRGEAWAERELKKERRQGTEHYVLGQHYAEVESDGDGTAGILTYCSHFGLVVILMGKHPDTGDWVPITRRCRVIGLSVDYGTSNEMIVGVFHGVRVSRTERDGENIFAFEGGSIGTGGMTEAEVRGTLAALQEQGDDLVAGSAKVAGILEAALETLP